MAGPQFVIDFEPMYGEMVEVSPLLRRLVCKNPSKFTFHGTGTYVIGRGDVAVVDPGPRDDDHIAALLAALDGETVRHILITHTHGDHSPAAHALHDATGAPILGFGPHPEDSVGEGEDRDDDEETTTDEVTDREPQIEDDPEFQRKHAPDVDFDPDTTLAHGDVVEGPGYTVQALHTPGHISNHLCFALAEEHAVLSGDHVMGWSTTIIPPPDGDVAAYLESLRVLLDRALGEGRRFPMDEAVEQFREHYWRHCLDRTRLYPGVKETLHSLDGLRLAVVSNKPEQPTREISDALELTRFFPVIIGGDTYPERKPHAQPLVEAANLLGVPLERCVMVGDSDVDIDAAKAAGIPGFWCPWGGIHPDRPDAAARSLKHFDELVDFALGN